MAILLRLFNGNPSLWGKKMMPSIIREKLLSTDTNKVDEPFNVEVQEGETVGTLPPTEKLLVLGGNGFVGSHVLREALACGVTVSSLSRSGRSLVHEAWADRVTWHQGDLLGPDAWKEAFRGVTSVISCVGGFGNNSYMYKINGTANINAIRAASEHGVKRLVYLSAAEFGLASYLLRGYYEGKRAAEREMLMSFVYGGVVLRPGFIYGTRLIGNGIRLPLGVIGSPLEMIMKRAKALSRIPVIGPVFAPPLNVMSVARVAVRAAINPVFPPGILDVYDILRYSEQNLN